LGYGGSPRWTGPLPWWLRRIGRLPEGAQPLLVLLRRCHPLAG